MIANQISKVCHSQYRIKGSVLPPKVCPYCFGCPIASIVAGVSGSSQTGPLPMPDKDIPGVMEWLNKVGVL